MSLYVNCVIMHARLALAAQLSNVQHVLQEFSDPIWPSRLKLVPVNLDTLI